MMSAGDDDRGPTSIFQEPWWVDAASGGSWIEATAGEGQSARLLLARGRLGARTVLANPVLTPHVGPRLRQLTGEHRAVVQRHHEIVRDLVADLPANALVRASLFPSITDWLPFHWAGFTSRLGRVLRITAPWDLDGRRGELSATTRLRLDLESELLEIRPAPGVTGLARFLGLRTGSSRARALEAVHGASAQRGLGTAVEAVDARGRLRAASLGVWDHEALYYLSAAWDPSPDETTGSSAMVWWWIQKAGALGLPIVFASPMAREADLYFEGFGAQAVPFLTVERFGRAAVAAEAATGLARELGSVARRRSWREAPIG